MHEDYPTFLFESESDWRNWLSHNSKKYNGLWLKIAKKDSQFSSVSYSDAVDSALCYGWIDGQRRKLDEDFFLQKFTPRR